MVKVPLLRLQECLGKFTMSLWKGLLKRDFSDVHLITFFGVCNFGNTSPIRVIFFFKNVQNLKYTLEMHRKILKKYFVFKIIVSELVELICLF